MLVQKWLINNKWQNWQKLFSEVKFGEYLPLSKPASSALTNINFLSNGIGSNLGRAGLRFKAPLSLCVWVGLSPHKFCVDEKLDVKTKLN